MPVCFDDAAVYARSKSEIICVDDEAAHAESLAGRAACCIQQADGARLSADLKLTYTRNVAIRADAAPHRTHVACAGVARQGAQGG